MATNDIYNSKLKYENFKNNLDKLLLKPEERNSKRYAGKYYCKNKGNLRNYKKLFTVFDTRDLSYIRRIRLLNSFRLITYAMSKDLAKCNRDDINEIIAFMHKTYPSPKTKQDFIKDIKLFWKWLFPEKDSKGRIDDTSFPYVVRHLSTRIDRSKEVSRNDRLTIEEIEKLFDYFSNDIQMEAYLRVSFESLIRPQELLYVKLKDIEVNDEHIKIHISEHGKEGIGWSFIVDSRKFLLDWINKHPYKNNNNSFLFICESNRYKGQQLKPHLINRKLRKVLKILNIDKELTCYSLKRNGVTYLRAIGIDDLIIQRQARWTSSRQLKVYDKTTSEDALHLYLVKKGIVKDENLTKLSPLNRQCHFCTAVNPSTNRFCDNCKRSLDIKEIISQFDPKLLDEQKLFVGFFDWYKREDPEVMKKLLGAFNIYNTTKEKKK